MANYYAHKNWTFEVAQVIREVDPGEEGRHLLWSETHAAALAALEELQPEFDDAGPVNKSRRMFRMKGGGSITASSVDMLNDANATVAIWFSKQPVPTEVRERSKLDQVNVLLEPAIPAGS